MRSRWHGVMRGLGRARRRGGPPRARQSRRHAGAQAQAAVPRRGRRRRPEAVGTRRRRGRGGAARLAQQRRDVRPAQHRSPLRCVCHRSIGPRPTPSPRGRCFPARPRAALTPLRPTRASGAPARRAPRRVARLHTACVGTRRVVGDGALSWRRCAQRAAGPLCRMLARTAAVGARAMFARPPPRAHKVQISDTQPARLARPGGPRTSAPLLVWARRAAHCGTPPACARPARTTAIMTWHITHTCGHICGCGSQTACHVDDGWHAPSCHVSNTPPPSATCIISPLAGGTRTTPARLPAARRRSSPAASLPESHTTLLWCVLCDAPRAPA